MVNGTWGIHHGVSSRNCADHERVHGRLPRYDPLIMTSAPMFTMAKRSILNPNWTDPSTPEASDPVFHWPMARATVPNSDHDPMDHLAPSDAVRTTPNP